MEVRMVDLKGQYEKIKPEIDAAIQEVIDSTAFIKGPFVSKFKDSFAEYLDVRHVIPCANGTDALQLAMMALDLQPGDEVITTPFTFVATAETIVFLGLKPVFVDVCPQTFNIDPNQIEDAITDKTRAIIPVHLFGQPCNMDNIMAIAARHQLRVIEDAAQSVGAKYKDKYSSTIGDIGTFSFFPSKNLGCYGDGGAVVTNDDKLAEKINLYANHGSNNKYYYDDIGVNSRLDAIQAAILNVKLKYLDDYIDARVKAADLYDDLLADLPFLKIPYRSADSSHVFHQYTLIIPEGRDEVQAQLKSHGVPSTIYYPKPIHQQSVYQKFYNKKGSLAVSESLSNSVLSLPMHTELNESMQKHIVDKLEASFALAGV